MNGVSNARDSLRHTSRLNDTDAYACEGHADLIRRRLECRDRIMCPGTGGQDPWGSWSLDDESLF